MNEAITTIAKWLTIDGQLEAVRQLLTELALKSRQEEGNLFYTVYQSIADPNTLFLLERYKDESALDNHRNSAHYQELVVGKIIPLLAAREIVQARDLNLNDLHQAE
ncbi:putative quinol monooxygenase [Spirosoma aerolatum]|uniref:putative quinol monooxygenase n=1 Tax=Spirosoma aerolatum TaxID=1211326 RepID=UPI0009AC00EA|nr:putative quinol monooxygenase [Spirosoma aerolatum]